MHVCHADRDVGTISTNKALKHPMRACVLLKCGLLSYVGGRCHRHDERDEFSVERLDLEIAGHQILAFDSI